MKIHLSLCELPLIAVLVSTVLANIGCPSVCRCDFHRHKVYCMYNHHIKSIPEGIPNSTVYLYVSFNDITQIKKGDFDGLVNLKTLDLKKNGITEIEPGAFSQLSQLETIYLTSNDLTDVDDDLFLSQTKLIRLYLGENTLRRMPNIRTCVMLRKLVLQGNALSRAYFPPYFENLAHLSYVMLSKNKISNLSRDDFKSLAKSPVQTLAMSDCLIKSVENGSFQWLNNLVSLKLSNTQLSTRSLRNVVGGLRGNRRLNSLDISQVAFDDDILPDDLFQPLQGSNLLHLFMSHNKIKVLKEGTFRVFGKLTSLDLRFCSVRHADPKAFEGLKSLQKLKLNDNELDDIPSNMPENIQILDLSNNFITEIESNVLRKMSNLVDLYLNRNRIRIIDNGAFDECDNLRRLDLSENSIPSIGVQVFGRLDRLRFLKLNNNKLVQIPTEGRIFAGLKSLQHLDLRDNDCTDLTKDIFSNLNNLTILLLQGNNLGDLISSDTGGDLFSSLISLQELRLEDNQIEFLPNFLFKNLGALKRLHLSDNLIQHWGRWLFQGAKNLASLDLAYNQISLINKTSLDSLGALETFNLTGNPFACTCDLVWFAHWLNKTPVKLLEFQRYACNSPQQFQGLPLKDFDPDSLVCITPNWRLILIISMSVFVALMLIILILIYKYRWKLRFCLWKCKMRAKRNRHVHDRERAPLLNKSEYDAYISTCPGEDEEWVMEVLLPEIDCNREITEENCMREPNKFMIFFDLRNGDINRSFAHNIFNGINNSRKVLLILTENYFKDPRCFHFTLPLVPEIEQETQQNMAIVIIKGDLPMHCVKFIPRPIRRRIDDGDYLQWREDADCQKVFWGKLYEKLNNHDPPYYINYEM